MCAQYSPPESLTPIFNPLLFTSNNTPYSQEQSNQRFVQTGSQNQTVKGTKLYDNLGMTGTSPFTWQNGLVTVNLSPQLPIWSTTFRLPLYTTNTLDDIVARNATQTLSNKILNTLQVGTNGTTASLVQYGRATRSGSNPFTLTFPTAFSNTPTVVFNMEIGNNSYLFTSQLMSVSTTNFTYRMYLITIANPSQCTVAGDSHTINWVAYITLLRFGASD